MVNSGRLETYDGDPLRDLDPQKEFAELRLLSMGDFGDTVADFEDEPIQVFGGIVGEVVKARIYRYQRRGKNKINAIVSEVIEASPHRVNNPCPYFGPCSGCQWQHVSYDYQLELKRDMVRLFFADYASLSDVQVSKTNPAPESFNYRNHARFTVRFGGQLGFSNRITRRFVRVDECMLMDSKINSFLSQLQDNSSETTNLSIRVGANTDDYLIQPELSGPDIDFETGQKWYVENMLNREFRVASPSFFQVNTKQAEFMINLVGDKLGLNGDEILVDAYAGVGVFASLLSDRVRKVIAVEESQAAVKDALFGLNDLHNVHYIQGKTEEILEELEEKIDVIILDPPRTGCHPQAIASVLSAKPNKIAYVSCDPPSLARDLDMLVQGGYQIDSVDPIDMFPQTYHTECVATLSRNN
ncbi:MAG: class I SAM-dependent RNA methyltransferase [Dehalococcoidia bacterium]|jgi:23S rRNA (uracil1939-C5)-methyltransferase|nr:class I SAM-dependent RNA methyltransferase [Dehalococcoidia bacterium]MEC7913503.1 class I SAM-dependent RNA methyltransferase [Chloroflexota bacterium]HBR65596.1 23S rRNA (uracil(1939)-C(5))-methyltransferase RlmD [Dehalococcoidia bacterium]|tara:strand:+ start:8165 stop:9406 length:1242 start_codon:yes stop_codon:yes gene_type:complete